MDQKKTSLERAFELAEAGTVTSVADIRLQLKREGYAHEQVDGRSLAKQLREIIQRTAAKQSASD